MAHRTKLILFAASVIGSYIVPILYSPHYTLYRNWRVLQDWNYYDALALVVRSNVLSYHSFPLHDPWMVGGMDILANPDNRIFSPLLLLDLIFTPHTANLVSLIVIGFLGLFGMARLLRELGVSERSSVVGAVLFLNSSYFGLHYATGHINYVTFQLIPWVIFLLLRFDQKKCQFAYFVLLALLLLNAGIATFVYSLFLVPVVLFIKPALLKSRPKLLDLSVFVLIAGCLSAIKLVPSLLSLWDRVPFAPARALPPTFLWQILFDPVQFVMKDVPKGLPWAFHEYGCYFGLASLLLVVSSFRRIRVESSNARIVIVLAFLFWIISGWGGTWNPWHLFQQIPILNNVRIPSRLLILAHIFFLILVARSLDRVEHRRAYLALVFFLVAESFFVRNYPFWHAYQHLATETKLAALIETQTIDETIDYGEKPLHYYSGKGCKRSYEPAAPETNVVCSDCPGYRGEAYYLDGAGEVSVTGFVPGELSFSFSGPNSSYVQFNTNQLLGWKVDGGPVEVAESPSGLLTVRTLSGSGSARLVYLPDYLAPCILLLLGGVIAVVVYARRLNREPATS